MSQAGTTPAAGKGEDFLLGLAMLLRTRLYAVNKEHGSEVCAPED